MNTEFKEKIDSLLASIKEARTTKGYSQEYVATKLGMSQNAYSKLEMGKTSLKLKRLSQLADILEIELSLIITY
jgi:transcriptional regulator with XRE-family HTH domain